MILEILIKGLKLFKDHSHKTKMAILSLSVFFLFITLKDHKLQTKESHYDILDVSKELFGTEENEYPSVAPHKTIYLMIKGSQLFAENIKSKIKSLRIKPKSIIFSESETRESYFVKIYITESKKSSVCIRPLRRFQPNSDILYLAKKLFNVKLKFSFWDIINNQIENLIEIDLEHNSNHIEELAKLARYYMNIDTHSVGTYYYIPIYDSLLRAEQFAPFIISMVIYSSFNINLNIDIISSALILLMFHFAPFICFLLISSKHFFIYAILFSIMNFRFGFSYCLLYCLKEIYTLSMKLKENIKFKNT